MPHTESHDKTTKENVWNHQGPVVFSPLFDWPPRPVDALLALTRRWVTVTRNVLFLLMAVCVYHFFLPDLAEMSTLSIQWIASVFVRNVLLITLVAGGLHLFLFTFRSQGNKLKFDRRDQLEKTKKFSFNNQVHDNILWSIASGVTVWTLYEVLYFWGMANNNIPTLAFTSNPIAFFSWIIILPPLMSAHFYMIHRLLHWPPLFKRVHLLHHKNIHIGPWSGMSMHPVEHIVYISSVLVHFVIASHPVILLLHLYTRCLAPAFSHSGFEKLLIKDKAITEAADFHHQLHHKYFECNYGNVDMPWDRWFGSVHDGSEEATNAVKKRRLIMYKNRISLKNGE